MRYEKITIVEAKALAETTFKRLGLPDHDAVITADHLIRAEVRGHPGHGMRRILGIASIVAKIGTANTNVVVTSNPGFVLFNAQDRLGIPAVHDALEQVCTLLDSSAAMVVGITGYRGTTGSLGIYGNTVSSRGIVSILMCNSEFAVAPHGSARAVLGTNPIAISMPGAPVSFSADVATAAWSYGSIRDAADAGKRIPKGIVQTEAGRPSTDPNDADNGSQLPMAGHKGYALGLAVELLCGPLIGGKAGRDAVQGYDGFFGVLVRAGAARPLEEVNADAQALFTEIVTGPVISSADPIRIPGQSASHSRTETTHISVSKDLLDRIRKIGTQ